MARDRAALRGPRRRRAELVGLLVGALAGWLAVGLAWPRAALASDALWLLGVVAGGLVGLVAQGLWRYGAVLACRGRRGAAGDGPRRPPVSPARQLGINRDEAEDSASAMSGLYVGPR